MPNNSLDCFFPAVDFSRLLFFWAAAFLLLDFWDVAFLLFFFHERSDGGNWGGDGITGACFFYLSGQTNKKNK